MDKVDAIIADSEDIPISINGLIIPSEYSVYDRSIDGRLGTALYPTHLRFAIYTINDGNN